MRFLLRLLSLVSLAAATIAGTLDSIQSIAASRVLVASFAESWRSISPASYDKWNAISSDGGASRIYEPAVQWLLAQPAFAVLLVVSLLLWMLAYRRSPLNSGLTV